MRVVHITVEETVIVAFKDEPLNLLQPGEELCIAEDKLLYYSFFAKGAAATPKIVVEEA